jgi:hypothetical protein
VSEQFKEPPLSTTLESLHDEPVVVRLADRSFDFPLLGAHLELPDGWTHLSTTSPGLAERPLFVNAAAQTFVALRSGWGIEWDAEQLNLVPQQVDGLSIDWIAPSESPLALNATLGGITLPMRFPEYQPVQIGRMHNGKIPILVIAFGRSGLNDQAIRELCQGITPAADR